MSDFMPDKEHAERLANMSDELRILPVRNTVAYPFSVLPLVIGIPRSVKLIEDALEDDHLIGLVSMKDSSVEEPVPGQVYEVGTVAMVSRVVKGPDGKMQVVAQGLERFRVKEWDIPDPYLKANIALAPDVVNPGLELDAMQRTLLELSKEVVALTPKMPDEIMDFLTQIKDPRYLAYLVAANAGLSIGEGQKILEADNVEDKFKLLISHLTREKEVLTLGKKIQSEAREEMDKAQKGILPASTTQGHSKGTWGRPGRAVRGD